MITAAPIKLRRATPKPLDHKTGTAGRWETADGQYLIYRILLMDSLSRGEQWFIAVGCEATDREEKEESLQDIGLHWTCGTAFPTRRAALGALGYALASGQIK